MIRIGRCKYDSKGTVSYPSYPNFVNIVVMMRSHSSYYSLSPYELQNNQGQILENIWQFSKIYAKVPKSVQKYSRWNSTVIWDHPAETHFIPNSEDPEDFSKGQILDAYWVWRKKGMNAKYPIRYPIGYAGRHKCLFSFVGENNLNGIEPLNYIEGRKRIYVPLYLSMISNQPTFLDLKARLQSGENLLIIEVDGPHQESMEYYKSKYGVADDFIESDTMLATPENLLIMLEDPKHPFGHGYCLAMGLLDYEV
jgi:hypothetical protein